jgi:hypothetical protein
VVSLGGEPLADSAESLRRFIVEMGAGLIARQFEDITLERPLAPAQPQASIAGP